MSKATGRLCLACATMSVSNVVNVLRSPYTPICTLHTHSTVAAVVVEEKSGRKILYKRDKCMTCILPGGILSATFIYRAAAVGLFAKKRETFLRSAPVPPIATGP